MEQSGYPFGEEVLILRAIATQYDASIMCGVENVRGEQIGLIRPTADISWFTRGVQDMTFVMTRPDGAPLLHFTSSGGFNPTLQVQDRVGQDLGRLRRSGSRWRVYTLTMAMEFNGQLLGQSKVGTTIIQMDKKVHEPIHDATGALIGHVDRQWHPNTGSRNPHYDYILNCAAPTSHPLPTLMLTVAFAHYMYDRIQMGGPLGGPRWKSPNN
ncbi:hypothetical protein [Mycolicibacterium sp. HK-90]|uniref:hypothetical protein n=1 Tax=Mycolicibacterium sp. HK-90 TaxID=3056937 RepID=UPI00265B322C|nr:hypothetical protein [Mycolicibacterium sp. HK-90]WKG04257.1 hypothetical protein QU592_03825 [Mycolicibacterium sp. HK-90]